MADHSAEPPARGPLTCLAQGETIVTALYQVASALPNRPALLTRGFGRSAAVPVTYGQLLENVERFAETLSFCGARRGETVALQVPNCWGSAALILACLRAGLVALPISPSVGEQDLEEILAATDADMCVVFDTYLGQRNAETLLAVSKRLPALRHRVVVGNAAATGALDFERLFRHRQRLWQAGPARLGRLPRDTDGACLAPSPAGLTTSTVRLYRHRDLYAQALSYLDGTAAEDRPAPVGGPGPGWEVFGTTYPLALTAGLVTAVWQPLLQAGTGVFMDEFHAERCLEQFRQAGVTRMLCPAEHWSEMVDAQRAKPRKLRRLCDAATLGPDVPQELADRVRDAFGVCLRVLAAPA
ncbi:AMP-binding protein [Streptomyces sp. NPDC001668]|uniref:AMP-binding protein n=1 Tax=unclassified Streptomyces TaxID=2593676 RepID=UPI0036B36637